MPRMSKQLPQSPRDFDVVVQTIPERTAALKETVSSIHASDIAVFEVRCQKPGETKQDNLIAALKVLAKSGKEWGVRFEDDVIVNRHIMKNLCAWGALRESNFGAGWLFRSAQVSRLPTTKRSPQGHLYSESPSLVGSLGVLFHVPMIEEFLLDGIEIYWDEVNGAQDRSMSLALGYQAKRVYIHDPPLVEHNTKFVSSLAPDRIVHPELHTTGGAFDPEWSHGA